MLLEQSKELKMDQKQREYVLKEYEKLIDAYDSTSNKYDAIAAILRVLAERESEDIYTADGYEDFKIAAVKCTDLHHIANLMEELNQ
jgi:hypothetical protein